MSIGLQVRITKEHVKKGNVNIIIYFLFCLSVCEQMCLAWDANTDRLYVVDQKEKKVFSDYVAAYVTF